MAFQSAGEAREHVWLSLMQARVALYPYPPFGHHPNFQGAAEAAEKLLDSLFDENLLTAGDTVLSYPDYVLKPLRKGLLKKGVHIYVPAKYGKGYRYLDSQKVSPGKASSIAGAETEGEWVEGYSKVKMTFIACVAMSRLGKALGKGYGFSLPDSLHQLPSATIVHPLQILEECPEANLPLSFYATPEKVSNLSAC